MEVPESLSGVPPSAKLVYAVLDAADGPLAQHEIAARSTLNQRQVRNAISYLHEHEAVVERPNLSDLREKHYEVTADV